MEKEQQFFTSRVGFIIACIAMAVGTGNIWRFPRMAAAHGGGAFVLIMLLAVVVCSIPILMSEMVIGRYGRKGTVGSYGDFMGRNFSWLGAWMGLVCIGLMFCYSVLTGWTIKYFVLAVQGTFTAGADTEAIWTAFTGNPAQTIFYHFIAMAICTFIVYQGVAKGIERYTKILLPGLAVLLIIAAVRAVTLPGGLQGLEFLFRVDPAYLVNPETWLQAFTQAAWSTGAGWALLMTYAIYTKPKEDVGASMFIVGFADVAIALVAGIAVLCTVFAVSPTPEMANAALGAGNTGLTFIYIARLFGLMAGGTFFASAFFLALAFAALSSLLSMVEIGIANLVSAGWERKKAAICVSIGGFAFGVPSAYALRFFENQDWTWGVALLVSNIFTAWAVIKFGVEKTRTEQVNKKWSVLQVGRWFNYFIYIAPVVTIVIIGWWIQQTVSWYPETWWHPFETYSTGTMLFQWAILLIVVLAANKWLGSYFNPLAKGQAPVSPEQKGGKDYVG